MGLKKAYSVLRWFLFAVLLQLVIVPLSYVLYPFAYSTRGFLRKHTPWTIPLWIFLDDEVVEVSGDDYGEDWWKEVNHIHVSMMNWFEKFITAYRWGVIRNPAWNQHLIIKPKSGIIMVVKQRGSLVRDSKPSNLLNFAVLKWVDAQGNYTDNQGSYISEKYSTLGKSFVWYKVGRKLYWRFSYAGYNKMLNRWIEIHLGTNERRYTVRGKIKKGSLKIQ